MGFDVSSVNCGHALPQSPSRWRECDEYDSTIGVSLGAVDESGVDEASNNAITGAIGDEQSFGQISHAQRFWVEAQLVENIVVIEAMAERVSKMAVHGSSRLPVVSDESFPCFDGALIRHGIQRIIISERK